MSTSHRNRDMQTCRLSKPAMTKPSRGTAPNSDPELASFILFWWQHARVAFAWPHTGPRGKVGVSHSLVSLSPSVISFNLPLHYPNREGQESFPAKLDESFRAVMEPSWRGLFKCTAHTFPLIHKALSMREPDKQHYYYHQSPPR